MKIGLYVFDGVEVLDFAGPFEVFTTANRVAEKLAFKEVPRFEVIVIGEENKPVMARAGLAIQVQQTIHHRPALDVLLIPGGVVEAELAKPEVIGWIRQFGQEVPLVASICTGAFLIAKAGMLDGKSATTHWEDLADLRTQFPLVNVKSDCRWVDEGRVVSSAGISAGIDMSLHLVERLAGRPLAEATARQMAFEWTENAQAIAIDESR